MKARIVTFLLRPLEIHTTVVDGALLLAVAGWGAGDILYLLVGYALDLGAAIFG